MGYVAQHKEKTAGKKLARGEFERLVDSYSQKYKIRRKLTRMRKRTQYAIASENTLHRILGKL